MGVVGRFLVKEKRLKGLWWDKWSEARDRKCAIFIKNRYIRKTWRLSWETRRVSVTGFARAVRLGWNPKGFLENPKGFNRRASALVIYINKIRMSVCVCVCVCLFDNFSRLGYGIGKFDIPIDVEFIWEGFKIISGHEKCFARTLLSENRTPVEKTGQK